MEILPIIGQVFFGLFFLIMGFSHFIEMGNMAAYAKGKKVPMPVLAVMITGMLLFLGGLSVLTGLQLYYGLSFLTVFFVFVTPWMHSFWADKDPDEKMSNQVAFLKNMALLGAVLLSYGLIDTWPWILSL